MGFFRHSGVGCTVRSAPSVEADQIADKPGNKLQIFFVADGSFVTQRPEAAWFNPHIRIIALAFTGSQPFSSDTSKWTLCIVGSRLLKESDRTKSFLQVASWNGLTFRFYQVNLGCLLWRRMLICCRMMLSTRAKALPMTSRPRLGTILARPWMPLGPIPILDLSMVTSTVLAS